MESTDTDILLEGHITGLKGRDINYSGAIASDDEDSNDYLFSSSPRKDASERPLWPGDTQTELRANSPLSTTVVTSGSQVDMTRVVTQHGESTPTYGGSDVGAGGYTNDSTPNNELASADSNSSFVMTQSITLYESSQQTTGQHAHSHSAASSGFQLISMIGSSSGATVQETRKESHADTKMFLDDSDSALVTANTSDVTLDLSNITSADTTHEEVTFPTPPPPIDVKEPELEALTHGSSTTSYQSSVFDEGEHTHHNKTDVSMTAVSHVLTGAVSASASAVYSTRSDSGHSEDGGLVTESITITSEKGNDAFFSSSPVDDGFLSQQTTVSQTADKAFISEVKSSNDIQTISAESETIDNNTLATKHQYDSAPPIVNALLQTMHRTLSASDPPDTANADKSPVLAPPSPGEPQHLKTQDQSEATKVSSDNTVHQQTIAASSKQELSPIDTTSSIKGKVSEKVAPNLVSSLSRHLEEKKTTIDRSEPVSLRTRSTRETDRRPTSKASSDRRESETSSPSMRQLSQQLAVEAVLQRESIRSRDGLTVSGLVKPSQRVASWKELEKKSLSEKTTPGKLTPKPSTISNKIEGKSVEKMKEDQTTSDKTVKHEVG